MDTNEICQILDKLNFTFSVSAITQFCREEDGGPYDVWKIETDSAGAVLKKIHPEERNTLEAFFAMVVVEFPKSMVLQSMPAKSIC